MWSGDRCGRTVTQLGSVIGEEVKDDPQILSLTVSENGGTANVEQVKNV